MKLRTRQCRPSQSEDGTKTLWQEGQALLEFALVATFLTIVIFGIIDFARLFFAYATMSQGAREAARFGITHAPANTANPSDPNHLAIIEVADNSVVLIGGEPQIAVTYPGGDDPSNPNYPAGCTTPHYCRIRVRIWTTLDVWTPIIPEMNIEAQATMHFE